MEERGWGINHRTYLTYYIRWEPRRRSRCFEVPKVKGVERTWKARHLADWEGRKAPSDVPRHDALQNLNLESGGCTGINYRWAVPALGNPSSNPTRDPRVTT